MHAEQIRVFRQERVSVPTFDNVRAHIYGTDWRSYNRGVTADDIANDARKELLNQIKYFQRCRARIRRMNGSRVSFSIWSAPFRVA